MNVYFYAILLDTCFSNGMPILALPIFFLIVLQKQHEINLLYSFSSLAQSDFLNCKQ